MPNVKIGNTTKRINSTSQSFTGTTLSCKLKEPCSMQAPIFKVKGLTKGALYNYASFEGHYYWIDDIVYLTRDIQEVHCHLDPLATFKTAIGNTSAYIKYGSKNNWQRKIDDPRMQPEVQPTLLNPLITIVNAFNSDVTFSKDNGTVIMRVMAIPDAGANISVGIHTYAMTMSQFRECLTDLSQIAINWSQAVQPGMTFNEICGEMMEFFAKIWSALGGSGSWVDNIFSCIYVPIDISAYSANKISSWSSFYIGSIVCDSFSGNVYEIDTSGVFLNHATAVSIPWSTQATTYPYLKCPRWNALQCILPGNYMDIDTTDLKDQTQLGWYSCINLTTGHWSGKIVEDYGDTNEVLSSAQGCVSIDLMGMIGTGATSGSVGWNGLSKLLSTASMGKVPPIITETTTAEKAGRVTYDEDGFATSNPDEKVSVAKIDAGGVASGIAGTFIDTALPVGSAAGQIGANGTELFLIDTTVSSALGKLILRYIQYVPAMYQRYEDYCDEYGYPFNDYGLINAHAGYVCCVGASVKNITGASEANKSTINSYLNGGFYYE